MQDHMFVRKEKFLDCQNHNEISVAFSLQQLSILEILVNSYIEEEEKKP